MQLDTVITGLKLLTALLLVCVAYLVLLISSSLKSFSSNDSGQSAITSLPMRSFLSGHSWERDSSQRVSIRSPSAWF